MPMANMCPISEGDQWPQLSMRGACDRCRSLKLKCRRVTALSESCERCNKARIACIFGRRVRAKRRRDSGCTSGVETTFPLDELDDTDGRPQESIAPAESHDNCPSGAKSFAAIAAPSPMSFFFGHITPTDDPFATHSLESAGEEVDLASAASTAPPFDEGGCDLATLLGTPDFAADKRFSGAQSPITASYHQNIPAFPGEDVFPSEPAKAGDPILSASNRNNSTQQWNTAHGIEQKFGYSSRATSQLLRLLPKIKQELSKFENGFWRNEGAASLDDYPIWNIVLMAREIREVASAIFGKSEEALRENQLNYQIGPTSHYGTKADTPAVLLLLCGHIWLMRLYSVVLDHVQNRIDDIPTVTDHSQLLDHATLWPDLLSEHRSGLLSLPDLGLGLGKLPCIASILELHRIYAEMHTLCTAVKSVECQLGGDGFQLREAAVTALQNDDYVPSGNLQSIEMRFDSLKQQLRTKIGF